MNTFRRPARQRSIKLPRVTLHYLDWPGDAPPILLLHPNRTNARVWDFVVEASARRNRFIAPDQRGHGLSDYPAAGYELDDYVADTIDFIETVCRGPVALVGAATGGNIALLIASQRPDLVRALAVADPGLSLDKTISKRVQGEITGNARFPDFATARAQMSFSHLWSPAMKDHYATHSFRPLDGGAVEWRYYPPGARHTEAQLEEDMWHRIAVRCPTLVMRGDNSDVFPAERMAQLQGVIPGAEVATVANCEHRVSQDQPEAMARLLDAFFAKHVG